MPVISFGLGSWQIKRLKWKTDLIAECEDRLSLPPLPLPKSVDPAVIPEFEYRRVLITGKFQHDEEMYVGPRYYEDKPGYEVITPMIRENGSKILIHRGWISKDFLDRSKRNLQHLSLPSNTITVECLLRSLPERSYFAATDNPKEHMYHCMDIEKMAKYSNSQPVYAQAIFNLRANQYGEDPENLLEHEKPLIHPKKASLMLWSSKNNNKQKEEELEAKKIKEIIDEREYLPDQFINAGVPIGKPAKVAFRNNHAQYIATWYGLCLFTSMMLVKSLRNPTQLEAKIRHARKTW